MLEYDQDAATITLCHWNDRQYDKTSDTPPATRARQRMSRQRHADVTPCHATDTDTDTDTEEIQRQKQSRPKNAGASAPAGKPASPPLPPAAQVFVENGGKWPSGSLADGTPKKRKAIDAICETVGDDPDALSFWGRVVAAYCLQWSGHSYTTMLGYFRDRRIPGEAGRNGNGHGPPRENAGLAAVRLLEQEDAIYGN